MCEKIFLRPSLDEIYDLQWSPDSMFVLAGAINSKVIKKKMYYYYLHEMFTAVSVSVSVSVTCIKMFCSNRMFCS